MKEFTLSIFTENKTGLLSRVVGIFTRRHINIESLTASESSMPGIYRYTVVVHVEEEQVRKLVAQIDKQVDVIKTFYYNNNEIVYQEIALYKIPIEVYIQSRKIEQLIRMHGARILSIEPDFAVIEKTGHYEETRALLKALEVYGVFEFVCSGRIAIPKEMEPLNAYLKSLEDKAVA